ncbi:glycosyltransferase WbuB [Bacteroidota bacterium]|nr:glycosyltransferase WbuB [Bacteroidota bacterium]
MKLLILTQYFPPEVGAPQNRLFELAVHLKTFAVAVTVITAMPNYPKMEIMEGYKGKKYMREEMDGIIVHRSSIYIPKSKSIVQRLLNYFSFVYSSWRCGKKLKKEKFDFLLCESPPLFLGISALFLSRKLNAKMIFNVSDLWPESAEKLGLVTNKFFLRLATRLEEYLYKKSSLITGQTQGIVKNISSRFPKKKVYWLKNGVDVSLIKRVNTNWRSEEKFSPDDFILLYAGILGHAQGLEVILKAAALLQESASIRFVLMGSGPEKEKLLELKDKLNLNNVFFIDVQPKLKMPEILSSVDVAIIPLRKLDLFLGAIPSKIFENLAMEIPILLGVDGEAKNLFVDEAKSGLFFTPENENELAAAIQQLFSDKNLRKQLGANGRKYVIEQFNRNKIASSFYNLLNENL